MNVKIENSFLSGTVKAIPSKSYAHRIAICNFLAGGDPVSGCVGFTSKDISATEKALKDIKSGKREIDCGESGSTLRFLLPLCAAVGGEFTLIGHGKLMERPNEELFSVMGMHGVKAQKTDRIRLSGSLTPGEYRIRGDISSQYVSGLLMALPVLGGDSKIVLTTPLVSAPYVEITLQVLKAFGVNVERTDNGFNIRGGQKYVGKVLPEGDWSNAAFFLAAGAINGDITVTGLNLESVQGDKYIIEILKKAGATVLTNKDGVTVKKSELKSFIYDAEDCPDLVPISAVIAAYADGTSVIKNIQRLKIKESDRIESTIAMLNAFGINAASDGENLAVIGGKVIAGEANSYNDHRIAMAAAVLSIGANGVSVVTDAKAINKSYPTFFDDYNSVGGKASDL